MENAVKRRSILLVIIIGMSSISVFSKDLAQADSVSVRVVKENLDRRHFIGSTIFLLGNVGDSVSFIQLNYGYQLSQKEFIIAEAITWTYFEPVGTYMKSKELYPGKVRAYGLGLGYQRFLWKNLYTTIEPTFFLQQFYDSDDIKIQKGFQLYLQFILGYRIEFFKKRMFIEPAIALKYWPVNTNFPAAFAAIENGAPKYKFEPGLNFGFRF